jgi:serine/threonine-protein kinase RsbW
MLTLRLHEMPPAPQHPITATMEVTADRVTLPALAGFVDAFAQRAELHHADVFALQLVVEEIVLNVIEHGGMPTAVHGVTVTLTADAAETVVEVRDRGTPYDPLLAGAPDINSDIDARQIGGLGVFLSRAYTNSQHYVRRESENVLTLRRARTTQAGAT